jgi:cytochrome c peroxidase
MPRSAITARLRIAAAAGLAGALLALAAGPTAARPITSKESVLPIGTELNEEPVDQPNELFSSELAGGKRSYLLDLGDLLFSSPDILGGVARQAGMSCETCHQEGANNPKLFVPGLSIRPGTFDVTNHLFNAKADNGVLDAVTPPSLRGARYLAPYAHDGRFPTLREFIRNAIVNEFSGPEPADQVLDALENYLKEISFLPNAKLGPGGRLTAQASAAAHRGEALFNKPFPHNPAMSCATCHRPDEAFVDHQLHDIGTGGLFKTMTLLNANLNAPYFHDGRFDSYAEVVGYFDRYYDLALTAKQRADLVAYLDAVGGADEPTVRDTLQAELDEIANFVSVLDTAIPGRNREVIALAVDGVGHEWRELGEQFPERSDTSVTGGLQERLRARLAVRRLVLSLRRVAMAAEAGDFDQAARVFADYRSLAAAAAPNLKLAERWSLFNPQVREAHFTALRRLAALAKKR